MKFFQSGTLHVVSKDECLKTKTKHYYNGLKCNILNIYFVVFAVVFYKLILGKLKISCL